MNISNQNIDGGKAFDWGRTSEDYAKFRDIYPREFYNKLIIRNLCVSGQKVLDLGTGTGVLPRNMYSYGAEWYGTDISPEQIEQAKHLAESENMNINFFASSSEEIDFPDDTFDVVTACQCFWYFDHSVLAPKLSRILKKGGKLVVLYMAWLPFEDEIAGKSEEIVLKYSPNWTGAGETRHHSFIAPEVLEYFTQTDAELYDIKVPFTRDSWHGRMKACRGVGASLPPEELAKWEVEHRAFMETVPENFEILHTADIVVLENMK
ncbi:class I SAM-dependent methyltransferase [Ruminococcus sp.]|uniref:class I SAM-dependent methyltransferase n=1 Tax=Ruminococcus sp. TaxID=41978 RepID=UPI0025F318DB|nr:class I SAM-dependent methyltransferase [Ruminococcus sp.]MBQ8965773.1 methyltransferase domain-containing protein [Ruminococcus sp.]